MPISCPLSACSSAVSAFVSLQLPCLICHSTLYMNIINDVTVSLSMNTIIVLYIFWERLVCTNFNNCFSWFVFFYSICFILWYTPWCPRHTSHSTNKVFHRFRKKQIKLWFFYGFYVLWGCLIYTWKWRVRQLLLVICCIAIISHYTLHFRWIAVKLYTCIFMHTSFTDFNEPLTF